MKSQLVVTTSLVCLLAGTLSSDALAETGFALNRFEAADAGGRWISADSLNIEGNLKPSFGIVSDWARKPFVVYADNNERAVLTQDQLFVHAQGSVSFADRVRVGVSVPIAALQRGSTVEIGQEAFTNPDQTSFGDIRVSGDLRLIGREDSPVTVAVGTALYLPTGSPEHLTGDGAVRIRPRVQAAGQSDNVVYTLRGGAHIRTGDSEFAGEEIGSEIFAGASIGLLAMDRQLLAGVSLNGATELGDDLFDANATPFELQVEAQYNVTSEWKLGAAVGPGLGRGIGVPATRVLLAASWYPGVEVNPAPEPVYVPVASN